MEFVKFNKIPRLNRDIVITEKIDGTNAQIAIFKQEDIPEENRWKSEKIVGDYVLRAGSRNRWIQPENDNMGFAKWVHENAEDLVKLGEGRHFGEWWGGKIQRGYGLKEKRFSLFNVKQWNDEEVRPKSCYVVPTLYQGKFDTNTIQEVTDKLKNGGSVASPGFKDPEGIIIYHTASGHLFKKTCVNDEKPKGI